MAAYFNKLNILKMREYFNINHLNREKFIMREIQVKKKSRPRAGFLYDSIRFTWKYKRF